MNYVPDAALFLLLTVSLVIAGWCSFSPHRSSFEAAFIPGGAFLGLLGGLVWAVGFWQLVPVFWWTLCGVLLVVLVALRHKNLVTHAGRSFKALRSLEKLDGALVFYLLFLFAITFVLTLAPPSGNDYDSLTYHLAVPAQYLRLGKVVDLPYDHHSYFPFTLEMLYVLGLAVRGAVFAKLFHWLMLPIGALALVAIGKRAHSTRAGLIGACLYASMPMVLQEAQTAYIDLGFAAFTFLAVLCYCGAPSRHHGKNLLFCSLFCGFCLGTKYFGALVYGFLGVLFLLEIRKVRGVSTVNVRHLAYLAIPALIIGAPWYIKNALLTGNPVFPFAYSIFGGRGWNTAMAVAYDVDQAKYGFGRAPADLLFLPWRLAMTPLNAGFFDGAAKGQPFWPLIPGPAQGHDGIFEVPGLFINIFPGPAILALGIPALFIKGKPREVALCTWFFGFLWFFWAFTSQQIRYLLPALGLFALVAGWGTVKIADRLPITRLVCGVFLALWLTFSPALTLWRARDTFPVLTGAMSSQDYLHQTFPAYDAFTYINNASKTAKYAVFGEPRCYYLDRDYFWADDAHNNLIDYGKLKDGAAFVQALQGQGATHVLWNAGTLMPNGVLNLHGGGFGPPLPLMQSAIDQGNLRLLYEKSGYRVYEIVSQ